MSVLTRNTAFAGIELVPYLLDYRNLQSPVLARLQGFSFNENAPVMGVQELGEVGITEFKRGPWGFSGACQSIFYLNSSPMHPTMTKMQDGRTGGSGTTAPLLDNLILHHVVPEWHEQAGMIVEVLEGIYFTAITHQVSPGQILIHSWTWVCKKYYTGDEWHDKWGDADSPNYPALIAPPTPGSGLTYNEY